MFSKPFGLWCILASSSAFVPSRVLTDRTPQALTVAAAQRRDILLAAPALLVGAALEVRVKGNAAAASAAGQKSPIVMGDESIMAPKAHGTTEKAVQAELLYGADRNTADRICSFNRRWAERGGYWESTSLASAMKAATEPITFYDSVTGKALFRAPVGRSVEDFLEESAVHGWPSFRDSEVVWSNVRVLRDGETVSVDGTHLGHDLPDRTGNRYCINLVSIAGKPMA